jgi:signal transduction histidine kinase
VLSFARRRYFLSSVAIAGLLVTWALMLAFDWTVKLGVVSFAPWVALLGFDLGVVGGILGAAGAMVLWLVATKVGDVTQDAAQIAVRTVALLLLGGFSALGGLQLRAQVRARRETALLQSALVDATLDGIVLTDADGEVLISNKPLRLMSMELGLPLTGSVQERLVAIADKMTEPERYRERMLELAKAPGEASIDEFEVAGTGRVFRGYTVPVENDRRIWTLREVTADRELDRMRDAFVATVSHELRTPLTSISGFLEMMEDEEHALGEAGKQYLDVIRRATERLHALVEDLLLIAQIEAHRIELELEPVDLTELAERACLAARPAAVEKQIELGVAADDPPPVLADQRRLTQVVDNLVSNAIKFTPEGGSVTICVDGGANGARIGVKDTGIGVPEDEQKQVFSRFFRASSATRRAIPGTGLGLAICHALVEQHGGSIEFRSREGEGTEVVVTLPAA